MVAFQELQATAQWKAVTSGVPQGSVWELTFLASLSVVWTVGLSNPSASLLTMPSCVTLNVLEGRDVIQRHLDSL